MFKILVLWFAIAGEYMFISVAPESLDDPPRLLGNQWVIESLPIHDLWRLRVDGTARTWDAYGPKWWKTLAPPS